MRLFFYVILAGFRVIGKLEYLLLTNDVLGE